MPYNSIEDINPITRRILPVEAQKIFMEAYNKAYESDNPEGICFARAWKAVKAAGYKKNIVTEVWEL